LTSSLNDAQHLGTLASALSYNAAGAIAQMTYGNGLVQTVVMNNRLQPCRINVKSSGTAPAQCSDAQPSGNFQDFTYTFTDAQGKNNGNVQSWSGTGQQGFTRSYTYDELNRLSTMASTGACTGLSWTYDIWANRTAQTVTGGSCGQSQITINTQNRIADTGYSYDAAGNLTAEPGKTYQYDAENRLVSINNGCPSTLCYTYNAEGRRVRKTASGTTTEYIYDLGGNVVAEKVGTTWTVGYVYLGGQLVAQYKDGTTYFVHKDHLGSTRLLTKLDKAPLEAPYDYLPYGEPIGASGSGTSHKFTGKERDPESGLDYFIARSYGSLTGRFMSVDPIFFQAEMLSDPQRLNLYAYVRNNPLIYIDPRGEAIQLTGDKKERAQQLAALCLAVGAEACPYLYENKVEVGKDKDGNAIYEYYGGCPAFS
jgi:RHS repeat-associated protein